MSPALAAALFHAPGLYLFTKRRLTPLGMKLNALALGATGAAMVAGGLRFGPWGVAFAWALGHTLWSVAFALSVQRLTTEASGS